MEKNTTNQFEELVSIITPMHNSARYISDTIESVISQTYRNWEMIIIDDFSTDSSRDIVKKYADRDHRIILIQLETKSQNGVVGVRNEGIKIARGRFISFLDSDDLWDPKKLLLQIEFMLTNKIAFSYANYRVFDENKCSVVNEFYAPKKVNYKDICKGNTIGCLVATYDASLIGKIYNIDAPKREDFATWLHILKIVTYAYNVGETLATYRLRKNSVSSKKRKMIKYQWRVYRKIERISFIKSCYYLLITIINKALKY